MLFAPTVSKNSFVTSSYATIPFLAPASIAILHNENLSSFLPSNGHSVNQAVIDDIKVDQVFIGSCTNGRLSDFKVAAEILEGKKVARHVRLIVTPGTQKILRDAQKAGYIDILVDAGAVVSNPTCGACLGGYMGILGDGEVCISTTNRNFVGRMGSRSSKIYLANSAVAAASAISGYITDPRSL